MMNDAESIKLAIKGREEGFRAIFANHSSFLFTHALRFTQCHAKAEDAVQETFSAAFRSIPGFKGNSSLRTWLYKILYHSALKINNSDKHQHYTSEISAGNSYSNDSIVEHIQVREVMDMLTEKDRAILTLAYWDELPTREIAEVLDLTIANAKVSLFRARKKFSLIWSGMNRKEINDEV